MEGPNKGLTPKKGVSAPKNSNFGVKESNENECNKVQNPKQPISKNFMSPTISAASKVSAPRKKILGERNGVTPFSDTNSLKSPNHGPKNDVSGQISPKVISSYSVASESDAEEKSVRAAYDPYSSYLSPRPKYLRFNPNRKREVLLQLESMGGKEGDGLGGEESDFRNVEEEIEEEFGEGDDLNNVEGVEETNINPCLDCNRGDVVDSEIGTFQNVEEVEESKINKCLDVNRGDVVDSENGTFQNVEEKVGESKINQCLDVNKIDGENGISQGVVKMHNHEDEVEENDDDEEVDDLNEEGEQYEEVHGWSLKGILKLLVVLFIFFLATLFAFSLYSTEINSEEVIAGPKYRYSSIQDHISRDDSMSMPEDGYGISMGVVEPDFEEILQYEDQTGYGLAHESRVENHSFPEESDAQSPKLLVEADMVGSETINWMINEPVADMLADATVEELADSHPKESDSYDSEESEPQSNEHLVEADLVESETINWMISEPFGVVLEDPTDSEESEPQSNEHSVEADLVESETINWMISEPFGDVLEDATAGESTDNHAKESDSYDNEEPGPQSPEHLVEANLVESETINWMSSEPFDDMLEDATAGELTLSHAKESFDESPLSGEVDNNIIEEEGPIDSMAARATRSIMVVVISALFSIISGSLVFIFRSKGRQASEVSPISIEKPDLTEEPGPVTPIAEENKMKKLAQPSAASSLFDFSEQAAKEFSQIRSPTVQLLGELVVREVERSLRRCDQKVDDELIESEESNNVQEKKKKKKATFQISSPPPALVSLEYSIADSPSCFGSFTTEAKISKRENGKDAEFTTPVRRSSRIRSRSVTPLHDSCSSAV